MPALWMIVASVLFACMGVCVKYGAAFFSTQTEVFFRGFVGVLMMWVLSRLQGVTLRTPLWKLQLLRGISGTVSLGAYFFAIGQLQIATAVTLSYTSPIFVALLLAGWFREQLRPIAWVAVLTGFAGVVLLLKPTIQPEQWLGALAGLGAGMLASVAYVSVRELGRAGEPEVRTVFYFSVITSAFGLPGLLDLQPATLADPLPTLALIGIGVFGGLAQLAMTRAYRYGKTLAAASLSYSTVIFASLFGMLIWNERLSALAWVGIGLIVASGILVSTALGKPAPQHENLHED